MTIKFAHVQTGPIRQTIGYRINDEAGTIEYAVAQCNPHDAFSKKRGREIVTGRIEKGGNFADTRRGPRSFICSIDAVGSTKYSDILSFILNHY